MNYLKSKTLGIRGNRKDQDAEQFSAGLIPLQEPMGAVAEAYRMLRTNLLYAHIDAPPKVVAVTSAKSREGKSTTCANLGISLSQVGKQVLILDCDLRNPSQHELFWLRGKKGLVDALAGESSIENVWHEPVPGLKVAPVGHVPPNATEIVNSWRFAELLNRVRNEFDYVLLDAPPVGLVSDAAVLAKHGDGVLLVLDAKEASKKALRQAMRVLEGVGANVLGTVMNKVRPSRNGGYGYSYPYYGSE